MTEPGNKPGGCFILRRPHHAATEVGGSCTIGHATANYDGDPVGFGPTGSGDGGYAYKFTLTNIGSTTADVKGFAVVPYDATPPHK